MAKKQRLDLILVERGLVDSRARAKARIMAGEVIVEGHRVDKAGHRFAPDVDIRLKGEQMPYVSRGGLKLQAALEAFADQLQLQDIVAIDVGASTGGFTDCLLQHGAARVYAVDVGYGQLAWKLRQDERVIVLERSNIRHLPNEAVDQPCALAVIDCSFISLQLVLPPTLRFLREDAQIICLIKPQFEVGPGQVGKGGVVRDADKRQGAIDETLQQARALGLHCQGLIDCPVHGPAGNIEALALLQRQASSTTQAPQTQEPATSASEEPARMVDEEE